MVELVGETKIKMSDFQELAHSLMCVTDWRSSPTFTFEFSAS